MKGRIEQAPATVLGLQDYAHVPQVKAVLAPYLLGARATGRKGANILLYGPAGVGKTECIRVLAGEAKLGLYEVAYADEAGAPIGGQSRLRAYRAASKRVLAVVCCDMGGSSFDVSRTLAERVHEGKWERT